jgi:beta-glucosidase
MDKLVTALRNYIRAHVAIYDGLKEGDQVDADGDGVAASVGLTLSVADWVPARDNAPSAEPDDLSAAARVRYVYHELFPASVLEGSFDADFDGQPDEEHADWRGKVDWLGAQYYFRAGVTGKVPLIPLVRAAVCFGGFDLGACLPAEDPTHWIPSMQYEFYAPGLYTILKELSARFPSLPLAVTESGIATEVGARRAEHIARSLEQIARARDEGVDVRGYLHWSLTDNFEWAEGFEPRFGLYRVDYASAEYARVPTAGAELLKEIAGARALTGAQRLTFGGLGPMTEEPHAEP